METANISSRGSCDFISKLPDPILHHILGLLNTKEAVQTCILSKRWENLWTFLPSLNFNFTDFRRNDDDDDDDDDDNDDFDEDIADCERFVKFVNNVLLRRETLELDVFRLSCKGMILYDSSEDEDDERDWIRYAMNHNTRVVHLSPCYFIPWSTYTCTSVQKLYLYGPRVNSLGQKVNLPNLKKLSIFNAYLLCNYLKNFLSGSPKLEFLGVDNCRFADCIVAHEHLKYLVLMKCHIKEELFVSAPNLLSFSYGGELSLPCKATLNMPSLSFAHLMIKRLDKMATCLCYLTNVELLELHFDRVGYKVLNSQAILSLELSIFEKLENMTVAFGAFPCFQMVNLIIKNSPNLKKLTILQREGCLSSDEIGASANELTSITSTSSTSATASNKNLEIVEIKYCIYDQMIRRLVDTLMDGTKGSKNVKIHLSKYESSKQYLKK